MLRAGEALAIHSLEGFLSLKERRKALRDLDAYKAKHPRRELEAGYGGKSVHHLPRLGLDGTGSAKVFTPQGRIEIQLAGSLPHVQELLEAAFFRRIEDIRRVFPSATWPVGWTYVEYGPGQFCASHADGTFAGTQVGALSVRLDEGTVGGEFYVETCGSEQIWTAEPEAPELILPTLYDNEWFASIPKTRWLSQQTAGTALVWGSNLIHGAQPITSGTAKKIIAWIEGA